LNQQC